MADKCFLILGGGGLVGQQVAYRIANDLSPERIVIASLYASEVRDTLNKMERLFGDRSIQFEGVSGNVFVRSEFADKPRQWLLGDDSRRQALFDDLLGPISDAYGRSRLVEIVRQHRPDVIVDSINTATAISYQNVHVASRTAKRRVDALTRAITDGAHDRARELQAGVGESFETLLLSQSIPQLIRHVVLLKQAMEECGTRLYLKIGTTGTGGMGLNIPYTHGEDKPSATLMSKTAIAFAHTGLLFLMARTVGSPVVKEIKPGAMIGYAGVGCHTIRERGDKVFVYTSRSDALDGSLELRVAQDTLDKLEPLVLPVVDTGENGFFTRGEFEVITSLRQMEYMTPEEIAHEVMLEITGRNTGLDVIAAIDGAVMNPSYRAGYLRQQALSELEALEEETGKHSVALGQLGPPHLSKLLWEAELLRIAFGTLGEVLQREPQEVSSATFDYVRSHDGIRHTITSIGVPILVPDGDQLIRGPFIRIPETIDDVVSVGAGDIDAWASKGWVDLRPQNFAVWQDRFRRMEQARRRISGQGSAAITRDGYLFDDIRIGTVVGWVFNNEEGGYRIKSM